MQLAAAITAGVTTIMVVLVLFLWISRRMQRNLDKLFEDARKKRQATIVCFTCHDQYIMCEEQHDPESVGECQCCGRVEPCATCPAPHYPPREEERSEEGGTGSSQEEVA